MCTRIHSIILLMFLADIVNFKFFWYCKNIVSFPVGKFISLCMYTRLGQWICSNFLAIFGQQDSILWVLNKFNLSLPTCKNSLKKMVSLSLVSAYFCYFVGSKFILDPWLVSWCLIKTPKKLTQSNHSFKFTHQCVLSFLNKFFITFNGV